MRANLESLPKSLTGSLSILQDLTGNYQYCLTERGPELDWMLNKGGLPCFRGLLVFTVRENLSLVYGKVEKQMLPLKVYYLSCLFSAIFVLIFGVSFSRAIFRPKL